MALKNLKKNFSFYALYLLSVSFVITVFFAFTSFSMNTIMLEKISGNGRVEMMCNVISVFLMAFVVFYMSYSNRFFLRRRTKELGVYALLGYRKTTVLGTILFISSFLPFVVHISKNNKRKFYTETKIITSPNFIYRMRSNSKTLIMLTLLSAATLTVSSVMALSLYYPIAAIVFAANRCYLCKFLQH